MRFRLTLPAAVVLLFSVAAARAESRPSLQLFGRLGAQLSKSFSSLGQKSVLGPIEIKIKDHALDKALRKTKLVPGRVLMMEVSLFLFRADTLLLDLKLSLLQAKRIALIDARVSGINAPRAEAARLKFYAGMPAPQVKVPFKEVVGKLAKLVRAKSGPCVLRPVVQSDDLSAFPPGIARRLKPKQIQEGIRSACTALRAARATTTNISEDMRVSFSLVGKDGKIAALIAGKLSLKTGHLLLSRMESLR